MVELTGIPAAELVGRPFEHVLHDITVDQRPADVEPHPAGSDSAEAVSGTELVLRHRDGERRIVAMRRTTQTDRLGAAAGRAVP